MTSLALRTALLSAWVTGVALAPAAAHAFCGLYVTKSDTKLLNKASKVVMARKEDKTVLTLSSDYQGDAKEFAIVIPVPTLITPEQVHITENALVEHLDAYTAPRLVEVFDTDPCQQAMAPEENASAPAMTGGVKNNAAAKPSASSVTIEDQYHVGEYDIMILSAADSDGLETWLKENGYQIPEGASEILASYIKQDMKFFVAKINLTEKDKLGIGYLRPIQVAYESPKFMLPIRLGTLNSSGSQDMTLYMLTPKGRVETSNYRTIEMPTDSEIPLYTKQESDGFYKALFDTQEKNNDQKAVILEYAWNMSWCDPCASGPVPNDKLIELGAFWLKQSDESSVPAPIPLGSLRSDIIVNPVPVIPSAFITRLHLRYDHEHFPEDLMFQETQNTQTFQTRYTMHHPWTGEASCPAAENYQKSLPERFSKEAETLAQLTGWDIGDVHQKMQDNGEASTVIIGGSGKKWYQDMWNKP